MERTWNAPLGIVDDNALQAAKAAFEHYWHPTNIGAITEPVREWGRGHSWAGLLEKGLRMLETYADLRKGDDGTTLALEYHFEVPLVGTDHTVSGIIDRLALRHYYRKPYISTDDYKTGRTKTYLRHDAQGHLYCYATTQREFWTPFGDQADELWEQFQPLARRFRWVSTSDVKNVDTWRSERDYDRLRLMVNAVANAVENRIFIPTLNGQSCERCDFAGICGDVPLPAEDDGRPRALTPSVP